MHLCVAWLVNIASFWPTYSFSDWSRQHLTRFSATLLAIMSELFKFKPCVDNSSDLRYTLPAWSTYWATWLVGHRRHSQNKTLSSVRIAWTRRDWVCQRRLGQCICVCGYEWLPWRKQNTGEVGGVIWISDCEVTPSTDKGFTLVQLVTGC